MSNILTVEVDFEAQLRRMVEEYSNELESTNCNEYKRRYRTSRMVVRDCLMELERCRNAYKDRVQEAGLNGRPGLYLYLYHGRDSCDEVMEDWGFDGPRIGPLKYVVQTYACHIKFEFCDQADAVKFGFAADDSQPEMFLVNDLVEHEGKYYGDWCVDYFEHGVTVRK